MTAEARWDSFRWRDANETPRFESLQHQQQHQQQQPQPSALQTPQSGAKDSSTPPWYSNSYQQPQTYAYDSRRPSQTYTGQTSLYTPADDRPPQSGDYGETNQASHQQHGSYAGSWRGDSGQGNPAGDKRSGDSLLSLQIPGQAQELPRIAHGYTTPRSDAPVYGNSASSWAHQTTSLPSFAALSEQTNRADEPDEVEIAPMSARLSCTQCTSLGPLVREVANAVAELDRHVQSLCSATDSRSADVPTDTTMRTVRWILDRVRYTKNDVQDVVRRGGSEQFRASSAQYSNPLKRSGEQWDQDDMPTLKLPRPNARHLDATYSERRGSIDFAAPTIQRSAYSPAPSESAPGSAYPRQSSPNPGRGPRALPSPTSTAFPQSAGASFVPASAASIGSPVTSYHPASSIHTVSTNSATSAHLQDLQHQVSLKSLALQTLQTEYATLLQKLQRERIKSQTIEKKTTVADQEVNDLTSKNEDLAEQVKTLESQLQDSERKRESERADAAKEKDQWSRMLDMSNRLQAKSASDYQRVAKEKADLESQLSIHNPAGSRTVNQQSPSADAADQSSRAPSIPPISSGHLPESTISSAAPADYEALRRENEALRSRLSTLRSALAEMRRQYASLEDDIERVVTRKALVRRSINQALDDETSTAWTERQGPPAHIRASPPRPPTSHPAPSQTVTPGLSQPTTSRATPLSVTTTSHAGDVSKDLFSRESLAQIARAVSPGPAELGFHVQPSTSSPEEIVQALGPVPATLPPTRPTPSPYDDWSTSNLRGYDQGRRQSQPFLAPVNVSQVTNNAPPHFASFRPLNQPLPPPSQLGQYSTASPHSHSSSPAPNSSSTSSPGTTSTHSPDYRTAGGREDYSYVRRGSQPHTATSPTTAAMPPPPRPTP